jgi:hypothetical protein
MIGAVADTIRRLAGNATKRSVRAFERGEAEAKKKRPSQWRAADNAEKWA